MDGIHDCWMLAFSSLNRGYQFLFWSGIIPEKKEFLRLVPGRYPPIHYGLVVSFLWVRVGSLSYLTLVDRKVKTGIILSHVESSLESGLDILLGLCS